MNSSAATRLIAGLALAGVSVIAAVVSYLHGLQVVRDVGQPAPVAYLIPFLADLVILGASASLLDASRSGRGWPPLAVTAAAVAIGVTLAMNVAAGWHHGTGGRLVAGWPAVAFILALESLAGIIRRGRGTRPAQDAPAAPAEPADLLRSLVGAYGSQRTAAAELRIPRDHLRKLIATAADTAPLNGDGTGE